MGLQARYERKIIEGAVFKERSWLIDKCLNGRYIKNKETTLREAISIC